MNLFTQQKQTHRQANKIMATKGERGERIRSFELAFTPIFKTDEQQGLTVQHRDNNHFAVHLKLTQY